MKPFALILAGAIQLSVMAEGGAQSTSLPPTDRILPISETDVFRIGGSNAPPWAAFRDVRAVAFDSAGTLYVLETRGARVTRIGRTGDLVGEIGRRGQGPGEFTAPTAMAVFPDGRVIVQDLSKDALLNFDPSGRAGPELQPEFPDGNPRGFAPAGPGRLGFASDILLVGNRRVVSGKYEEPAISLPVGIISLTDSRARTIARAWLPPFVPPRERFARALLGPIVSWAALNDGTVAFADTLTYRITLARSGDAVRTITRPLPVPRTTAADRAWVRADLRERMIDPSGRPRIAGASASGSQPPAIAVAEVERGMAASTIADELQIIRRMGTDWNNRLWVQRIGATVQANGPVDIIESTGAYVGTLAPIGFPDAFGPGGLVAYIDKDANDAPIVIVKRVTFARR